MQIANSERAALVARKMRERFGARDPRSMMLRFHAQTAGSSLTRSSRKIISCASRYSASPLYWRLQSLHANALDKRSRFPLSKQRCSRAHAADHCPGNGLVTLSTRWQAPSPLRIEADEIEAATQEYISKIDARWVECCAPLKRLRPEESKISLRISASRGPAGAGRRRREPLSGGQERPIPRCKWIRKLSIQVSRLDALRARRDSAKAKAALARSERRAAALKILCRHSIGCESYATVGESRMLCAAPSMNTSP